MFKGILALFLKQVSETSKIYVIVVCLSVCVYAPVCLFSPIYLFLNLLDNSKYTDIQVHG